MEKKVIVSIDPFDIKRNVVGYAEAVARAGQRELLIYSVQGAPIMSHPVTSYPSPGLEVLPGHLEAGDAMAKAFHDEIKQRYPRTELEVGVGFTATSLVHKIQEMADTDSGRAHSLLVLPKTHEYSWWNEVIGTVETTVAAEAPCPVLIVPENVVFDGITRIMYLADLQAVENFEYPGFKFLTSFAKTFDAGIVVAFMANPSQLGDTSVLFGEAVEKFRHSRPFQVTQEYRFFPEHSPEEILQTAAITKTDILAFPYRETNVFQRFMENEVTRTLILKSDTPVLVF